jgi:hypothetical protein
MHIIMGMPPHIIIAGIPVFIIPFIMSQAAFIMSICAGSVGAILQTMPSLVISTVILHVIMARIGIMPLIGFIMPIMGFIIGFIICIGICIGMPPICIGIGIIMGMPIMPFCIGMPPMGMGICIIISGIIIGAAFMAVTSRRSGGRPVWRFHEG